MQEADEAGGKLKEEFSPSGCRRWIPAFAGGPERREDDQYLNPHLALQSDSTRSTINLPKNGFGMRSMPWSESLNNPSLHEAVMRERSHEYGEVLRHAMVKVSLGPGSDAGA